MASVNPSQIREHMPVLCSDGKQVDTVDHLDAGNTIKLTKNAAPDGRHHWIPMDWVDHVDEHVHLNRSGDQVTREWMSSPPAGAGQGTSSSSGAGASQM